MKDIFKKEIARVFSDKKMIFSLFILPAVIMLGMSLLMGSLFSNMESDIEEYIPSVYVQNAPEGLQDVVLQSGYGETAKIVYLAGDTDVARIKEEVKEGATDLLVVFDKEFLSKAENYKNAGDPIPAVTMVFNSSRNYSTMARNSFGSTVLGAMETSLLQNRFGNLDLLTVFATEDEVIVNEKKAGGEMLSMMLPYFIVFLLFAGSMGICMDAIAGEKERGTMASMLLSPVKRSSIVFGKIFGLAVLSGLSSVVYAVSTIIAMPKMFGSLGGEMSMSVSFTPLQMVELFAIMISLVLLYVAGICLLSSFAKNAKEASTYVMPLYMVVLVLGILTMFSSFGGEIATAKYAIPIYGSAISIQAIVMNELSLLEFGVSVGSNILVMIIAVVAVVKVFNNEKIMMNA